jgi:hypothetical protein
MGPSRDGSAGGASARRNGAWRNAALALAAFCALLGLAAPARALTSSSTTVIPAMGAAGQGTAITVIVSGGGEKPSGTVTLDFGDGSTSPPVTLTDGTAVVIHIYAGPGSYPVTANYGGDASFEPSTGIGNVIVSFAP